MTRQDARIVELQKQNEKVATVTEGQKSKIDSLNEESDHLKADVDNAKTVNSQLELKLGQERETAAKSHDDLKEAHDLEITRLTAQLSKGSDEKVRQALDDKEAFRKKADEKEAIALSSQSALTNEKVTRATLDEKVAHLSHENTELKQSYDNMHATKQDLETSLRESEANCRRLEQQRDRAVRSWNLFLGFLFEKGLAGDRGIVDVKKFELSNFLGNLKKDSEKVPGMKTAIVQ